MWWRLSTVEAVNRGAEANNMSAKPIASRDEDITGLHHRANKALHAHTGLIIAEVARLQAFAAHIVVH